MNLFCFFLPPHKKKRKPNTHCTHLQIAQANTQPKFAKECNLSPAKKCHSFLQLKKAFTFVRIFTNRMGIKSPTTGNQRRAARYAKAMAYLVRMYVLELLSNQSCCYSGDLSNELPIAKSTLSQHLKELKDAGLIQGENE